MRSMTGYGRGEYSFDERHFTAEIKAVNHRYNDINIKLPRIMLSYEDKIKKLLQTEIFRGKTELYISFETFSKDDIKVRYNEAFAQSYAEILKELKEKFCPKDEISLSLLARFPQVISVESEIDVSSEESSVFKAMYEAVKIALDNFIKMRITEGENLKLSLIEKLDNVFNIVKEIEKRAPEVAKAYKERLSSKLMELEEIKVDEARILTEVAIFADKACIDEELTRLFSHIGQMKDVFEESVPVGKKLDFIVQEINREINTVGSKSNDAQIG